MKYILTFITTLLLITSLYAEKYNPTSMSAQSYEVTMRQLYKTVTAKDAENLRLCKIFSEKGKEYKALNRSDIFYDETVKNCERRVKLYCGALMSAQQFETK